MTETIVLGKYCANDYEDGHGEDDAENELLL
jgi:hypothetical protein